MFHPDLVASDGIRGFQIDRMQIQTEFPGQQMKRRLQIGTQFLRIPGASGIIPRAQNPPRSAGCAFFKTDYVIPLPAVHGNRDFLQTFQRKIRIDPERGIKFPRGRICRLRL